jgi:hypothetical protein
MSNDTSTKKKLTVFAVGFKSFSIKRKRFVTLIR